MKRTTKSSRVIPKLVNGRGTIPLSVRTIVGHIRVPSGTTDPDTYRDIRAIVSEWNNLGRAENLQLIKDREIGRAHV